MTTNTFLSATFALAFFTWRHFTRGLLVSCLGISLAVAASPQAASAGVAADATIKLWNGNKTASRQQYEREVLELALKASSKKTGDWALVEDLTDYPRAEDEASVFRSKGFDIFGTVAGNTKLANEEKILIPLPLMKGLLGHRILIIRATDKEKFAAIKTPAQLQQFTMGIPATWADAELFRQNGYPVVEKGSFEELFTRLENKEFDYVTFGANEVTSVFKERAAKSGQLMVESSLLVFYPFPLVFYVNPDNTALAERVTQGLKIINENGELDKIFDRYFAADLTAVNLHRRTMITLKNPILPTEMADFKPSL